MQYIIYVGAQLIGEEPRFELCRCTAFSLEFYYYPLLSQTSLVFQQISAKIGAADKNECVGSGQRPYTRNMYHSTPVIPERGRYNKWPIGRGATNLAWCILLLTVSPLSGAGAYLPSEIVPPTVMREMRAAIETGTFAAFRAKFHSDRQVINDEMV